MASSNGQAGCWARRTSASGWPASSSWSRSVTVTRSRCTGVLLPFGVLASGVLASGVLGWRWLVDSDATMASCRVQVVEPLGPPGDGPLAAVQRASGSMRQRGGELVRGEQPAVVGPQLVDRDDLGVVVGPLMLIQCVQVVGELGAGLGGVAAVAGVQPVVILAAACAVVGGGGERWGGDAAGHAGAFHHGDGIAHLPVGEVVAGAVGVPVLLPGGPVAL